MSIRTLNGRTFAEMILAGAQNLSQNASAVDALNVFPVPDGDTGTNMNPMSSPLDNAEPTFPISSVSICSTSLAPEVIDRFIFVPVSPSGTGNTFRTCR